MIQTNPISQDNRYITLEQLVSLALQEDPDLAALHSECLNKILQTLFIVTGDYISYFRLIGQKTFLDIFYQHAKFITGSPMLGRPFLTTVNMGSLLSLD